MNQGVVIGAVLMGLLIAGFGLYFFQDQKVQPDGGDILSIGGEVEVDEEASNNPQTTMNYDVEITSSGFSPKTITISQGDSVTFTNTVSGKSWPASAVHPTHTVYPETGGCIGSKFDACQGLEMGESYTFTFDEVGTWNYHDHLSPSDTGKIIVE